MFSSTVAKTEEVGVRSPLETIVRAKLQIINNVATTAVALVIKFPADFENINHTQLCTAQQQRQIHGRQIECPVSDRQWFLALRL